MKCFFKVVFSIPVVAMVFLAMVVLTVLGVFCTVPLLPLMFSGCFDDTITPDNLPFFWGFNASFTMLDWWTNL